MIQKEAEYVARCLFRVAIVLSREEVKVRGSFPVGSEKLKRVGMDIIQEIENVLFQG